MKKKERDTFCQESATNTAFKRGKGEKKETSSCFLSVVLERSSPPPFYSQSSVEFFREFILNIRTAFFINISPPTRNQFGFFFFLLLLLWRLGQDGEGVSAARNYGQAMREGAAGGIVSKGGGGGRTLQFPQMAG